jgi:hypothetical protein
MLSCFGCRQNLNRNKCPRGCVITRANAAGSNTVRSSTKIKAAGGYMTMGGYQTVGFTVDHHFVQLNIPFLASFCFILEK